MSLPPLRESLFNCPGLTKHGPLNQRLQKVLSINRFTGIDKRAAIGDVDHPLVNQPSAPSITQLNEYFRLEGVRLSVNACQKAIQEWGGRVDEITHVVSTTCTNSANPGFDHYVIKELGLKSGVERVLLHGVGCAGGLAAIRTASNLALGSSFRRNPARVLVIACEISSLLVRSELDSIDQDQTVRIGVCLFSDCASSIILSNGIGDDTGSSPIYDLLGWRHEIVEDTDKDLGFDVDPLGRNNAFTTQ
jgi:fungal type III polyketide synthase